MLKKETSFVECKAYVYHTNGDLLATAEIAEHNHYNMEITLKDRSDLKNGATCKVFILTFPTPYEYMGTVRAHGEMPETIALYRGKEKESRKSTRYKIDASALIDHIIRGSQIDNLDDPLAVRLVNISTTGVRIRASCNILSIGEQFVMRMKIGGKQERLLAQVANSLEVMPENVEYGCRLVARSVSNANN